MESTATPATEDRVSPTKQPRFSGFSHASLPCRDLEQSKRFFTRVMGGELVHDIDGFAEVRVAGVIIGLAQQKGGWTGWDAEFPHYAFFAGAEDFLPMVEWLRKNGVKTTEPWTRDGVKGLAYFGTLPATCSRCIVRSSRRRPLLCAAQNKEGATRSITQR